MLSALRRNCLILHAGALGDFVLTWPLVMALSRIHPQSRIIVVTHASKGHLAEAALRVESADIEAGWHTLFSSAAEVTQQVQRLLAGSHAVYSFISDEQGKTQGNLKRVAGDDAQVISLKPRPGEDYAQHTTQFLLDQLAFLPAVRAGVEQMIRSISTRGIGSARSDSGDILIHPGSGGEHKRWPLAHFVKLIDKLKRKKLAVRVLLGEVEAERLSDDDVKQLESSAEITRPQSYVQLFNELRHSSIFVGNDSGPAHLAGMIGVKTVAIFGATNPVVWKPLGPKVKLVSRETLEKVSVDEVLAAATA
ncbi:MAG TPA: glycosyltransferase family 9 protein [Tepidisphaeraceae bacterium]|jgi:ADP-heptose:LPS heptosyltransferase